MTAGRPREPYARTSGTWGASVIESCGCPEVPCPAGIPARQRDEALEELEAGKVQRFETPEDLLADLWIQERN